MFSLVRYCNILLFNLFIIIIHLFVIHSVTHSFILAHFTQVRSIFLFLFQYYLIVYNHLRTHSFVRSTLHSFIHHSLHSRSSIFVFNIIAFIYNYLFTRSFLPPFIHSFIYSSLSSLAFSDICI